MSGEQIKKFLPYIENLLNIGIALSTEKNLNHLLEMVVTEARRISNCDAGTLYLKEKDSLVFKIIQNESLNIFRGANGEEVNLPPVPLKKENVSAYVALTGQPVNIPDVYNCKEYDFFGPYLYDQITSYRTKSMLVVPLQNHENDIIGVLQLINSFKPNTKIVCSFPLYLQKIVESLASQAAVAITNFMLIKSIENLFKSFVQVMATAIDARTPYNADHTRRVAHLAGAVAEAINRTNSGKWAQEYFGFERKEQLIMAGWLHDIGKIAVPLEVMNKSTRLTGRLEIVLQRMDYISKAETASSLKKQLALLKAGKKEEALAEEHYLQGKLTEIKEIKELVIKCNQPDTLIDESTAARLREIHGYKYLDIEGRKQPYLTAGELESLLVQRGTLTNTERKIVEQHVEITARMLEKIPFIKNLNP